MSTLTTASEEYPSGDAHVLHLTLILLDQHSINKFPLPIYTLVPTVFIRDVHEMTNLNIYL